MNIILVIEDDNNVRENIVELLENDNFQVLAAANGAIGLQLAQKHIPNLIICDVMMPDLDGYDVLKRLRKDSLTATIPFIFLTAKSAKNDFRQGMVLGADDYIAKPFTRQELLEAIDCRLEKQVTINQRYHKKLNELRSSITFSLPHEMRTPLNGILGYSKLMMDDSNILHSQEIHEMATGIYQSGKRLFSLIQKFLLYAELEIAATDEERIKSLQSQETIFPTMSFIDIINEKSQKAGREADLKLSFQKNKVKISEKRLNHIIEELIDNALKFSPPGTSIELFSKSSNNIFTLSITDHGRGMTVEQIAELGAYRQFERRIYEQQGIGLGLIIVKNLAELHGGQFKIHSQPEEKTIMEVLLPCV